MSTRAMEGTLLETLVTMAIPLLQKADEPPAQKHPGRVPTYQDWQIAILILPGLWKKRKSKSAVYRQMLASRQLLMRLLNLRRPPARSTFMKRYGLVAPLARKAVELQGRKALQEHLVSAEHLAGDKSILKAKGPVWHQKFRKQGIRPRLRNLDTQAGWGRSATRGWIWGYSYEVAVSAGKTEVLFPLIASADTAEACEMRSFLPKIHHLPRGTRTLCVDSGYDSNQLAESFESRPARCRRRHRRRRFLCPPHRPSSPSLQYTGEKQKQYLRRLKRLAYLKSRQGQRLYRRRKETVERFNALFKHLFELEEHVWHKGLGNNQSMMLLAIFSYQLLLRYHFKRGGRDEQIQYILDSL